MALENKAEAIIHGNKFMHIYIWERASCVCVWCACCWTWLTEGVVHLLEAIRVESQVDYNVINTSNRLQNSLVRKCEESYFQVQPIYREGPLYIYIYAYYFMKVFFFISCEIAFHFILDLWLQIICMSHKCRLLVDIDSQNINW